jgi:hypothetical protein
VIAYLRRHHLGLIALFVALGGTSYAAVSLPRDSVGVRQLKSGAVTSRALARGSITTGKLAVGLAGALAADRIGPAGPAGATGPQGPPGAPGATAPFAWGLYMPGGPASCDPTPGTACPPLAFAPQLADANNVTLGSSPDFSHVCLVPAAGITASAASMVVSVTQTPTTTADESLHADWVPSAPDCPAGQMEVHTYSVDPVGGVQQVNPDRVQFSFEILQPVTAQLETAG